MRFRIVPAERALVLDLSKRMPGEENDFEVFGFSPAPWVDPAILKQRYLALAARLHPDCSTGDAGSFARLAQAHERLSNPADRIHAFVEIAFPDFEKTRQPPPEADLFMEISDTLQQSRQVRLASTGNLPHLVFASLLKKAKALKSLLETLDEHLETRQAELEKNLRGVTADLQVLTPDPGQLIEAATRYRFFGKWKSEIREEAFLLQELLHSPPANLSTKPV